MSNINDNNLDDLLRRAAEKYPLRTDSADFTKLVSDLEKDPSLILPPLNNEDRRRRRRFIWLFLLLPLGGGAYFAWHAAAGRAHTTEIARTAAPKEVTGEAGSGGGKVENGETAKVGNGSGKVVNKEIAKAENRGGGKVGSGEVGGGGEKDIAKVSNGGVGKVRDGVAGKVGSVGVGNTEKEAAEKVGSGGVDNGGSGETGKVKNGVAEKDVAKVGTGVVGKAGNGEVGTENGKDEKIENSEAGRVGNGRVGRGQNREIVKAENGGKRNAIGGGGKVNGGEEAGNGAKGIGGVEGDRINNNDVTIGGVGKDKVSGGNLSSVPARKVDGKLSLASTRGTVNVNIPVKGKTVDAAQSSTPQKDKIKLQKPKRSFYVGILGSPDLSTIRMQSVKSVGYNLGVLLGYSFNSRWSIETGLYLDRKKYYTDGEYFSKEKLPSWLYNYNIKTVDGYCNMWEIPLNVRYNFSRGDKMKWFATGGFSTYFMTKEVYSFAGTNATGNPWGGTWPYKKPYSYLFSIVNLSAGFEQRLGKIGNLRLEPYVRVPLSGIGTGNLSIMSAGLNIGITRRIW